MLAAAWVCACGQRGVEISVGFPSPEAQEISTGLAITALIPTDSNNNPITCDQINEFPPLSVYRRVGSELPEIPLNHLIADRLRVELPLGDEGNTELELAVGDPDEGGAEVLLLVVEAMRPVRRFDTDEETAGQTEEGPIASGCVCVQLVQNAEGMEGCIDVSETDAPVPVPLTPIAPAWISARSCLDSDLVTVEGQRHFLEASGCLDVTLCEEGASGACFNCSDPLLCEELYDLSNVPIHFSTREPAERISLPDPTVLTGIEGWGAVEVENPGCDAGEFTLEGGIVGRELEGFQIRGHCLPAVSFSDPPITLTMPGEATELTLLPETASQPAQIAVLAADATLHIFDFANGALQATTSTVYTGEQPAGLLGYGYDPQGQVALLAVATELSRAARLRVLRMDGSSLRTVGTMFSPCSHCGCGTAGGCGNGCGQNVDSDSPDINLSAADVNNDGYTDLGMAVGNKDVLTLFESAPSFDNGTSGSLVSLAPLSSICKCMRLSFGIIADVPIPDFELLDIGGPLKDGTDIMVASDFGVALLYASQPRFEGKPCAPGDSGACAPGDSCEPVTADGRYRCVKPCTSEADCDTGGPHCMPSASGQSFCASPRFECTAPEPLSIGNFARVGEIEPAQLTPDTPHQDAVVVGDLGVMGINVGGVRVVFGSNLSILDSEAPPLLLEPGRAGQIRPPSGSRAAAVADFNGDGTNDVAVLYGGTNEIRVWLSTTTASFGEIGLALDSMEPRYIELDDCDALGALEAADFDGDGRAEILVVCKSTGAAAMSELRVYAPASGA